LRDTDGGNISWKDNNFSFCRRCRIGKGRRENMR
jgi:hypothetical protein